MKLAFWRTPTIQEQVAERLTDAQAAKLLESFDLSLRYVMRDSDVDPDGTRWTSIIGMGGKDQSPTDYSRITDETELTNVRDECRNLATENPFAIGFHENMVNYVIGDGDKPTIVAKKGEEIDSETLKPIQDVLDEWIYDNDWVTDQQEAVRRYDRDGEFFRRFFKTGDGNLAVRFVEPNHVAQPASHPEPHCSFGIETDPDDVLTVQGYWVRTSPEAPFERIPAEEMQHVKGNVDKNVKRGLPTTWAMRQQLLDAAGLLKNIAVTSQIQTSIALIRRHMGGTSSGAQAMRASAATWTQTDSRTGQTTYHQKRKPGAIIDAPANTEYDFPASGLDVEKYGAGVQAILRGAAARVCFPEFMFTSDASNSNYASTMVAEGPAVRMFQRRQKVQKDADLAVLWKVLEYKAEVGLIDASLLELVEIQTEPPTVNVRDEKAEAETNKLLADAKILSPQTWAAKSGLEYEQEQANIEQHQKDHPDQMQQAEIDVLKAKAQGDGPSSADLLARRATVGEAIEQAIDSFAGTGSAMEAVATLKKKEGGKWVTINGVHVYIDKSGKIAKGPKGMAGKRPEDLDDGDGGPATQDESTKLSKRERDAIEDYTTDYFQEINDTLRKGEEPTGHIAGIIKNMDSGLEKMPKHKGTVFRVIEIEPSVVDQLKSGTFSDPAYMSTSKSVPDVLPHKQQIGLQIRSKTGVDISSLSLNPGEEEVLFPRGTKFRVAKMLPTKHGGIGAILEEI